LYKSKDVGELKVEKAREVLNALNDEVEIEIHATSLAPGNARELVRAHDLVLDGSDNFSTRYCLNDACVLENRPLVSGALHKFEAQISVLNFKGGPCYRCLYPEAPPAEAIPNCQEAGVLGVLPGMAGTLMATEAIKMILGIGKVLSGKLLHVDALTLSFVKRGFRKDEECPVCGVSPRIVSLDSKKTTPGISWTEFSQLSSQFLLDVRNSDEVSENEVKGFLNIPLPELASEIERGQLAVWPRNEEVIVICQSGKRSARAVEILTAAGFFRACQIEGGVLAKESL
jgi:sulfur-carrier protein adenylyltransferase/sulfurtransferase